MLAKLIIFFVDLFLALAIFVILYAVYLIAATGIFVSFIFYIFRGEMDQNDNFNHSRVWVLDSSKATEKPFSGNTERLNSKRLPAHFPTLREAALFPEEYSSVF
ncbi:hypothetical protein TREES_T100009910 [Tupaia chinensis]|uniref:Uncharacterized protein n=1 Tax=Tupaia chinensis TaxID=246437 RepID=L9KNC9_TUPCH|nr:hypothetical protein TREES_T100009910 [Tupaia chinensis]